MATGVEGYTSLTVMWPALAFHAVVSASGAHLLTLAARRADAMKPAGDGSVQAPVAG